ncbi:MAG: hypothetical protein Q7V56_02070 [Gammaproteobacteria bacterium]|nr:hypothetical protein [Gammaproteobacteria bacterium]
MAVAIFCATSISAYSQIKGCQIDETLCVEERVVEYCRNLDASVSGCLSWIEELESPSFSESINAMIAKANSYFSPAELFARQNVPENASVIERYQERSRSLYQEAYDEDNSNVEALYGLAATSETLEENSRWLREIAAIDLTDHLARRMLAGRMARSGSSGALEAGKFMISAYDAVEVSGLKWNLANTALGYLEDSGDEEEYESFRSRVMRDLDLDSLESDIRESLSAEDINTLQSRLSVACNSSVIDMFGGNPCDSLVLLILELSETMPSPTKIEVLDVTAESAKNMFGNMDIDSISEWHQRLRSELQENFVATGTESAGIYSLYEVITRDDPELSLHAGLHAIAP